MKLATFLIFLFFSNISYSQVKDVKLIEASINSFNSGNNNIFEYDEITNALKYNLFFLDEESFKTYLNIKNEAYIFQKSLNNLYDDGVVSKLLELGISTIDIIIKSEDSDEVLKSSKRIITKKHHS